MSVSKYNWTEECNERNCPGDCDLCGYGEGLPMSQAERISRNRRYYGMLMRMMEQEEVECEP